MFGRRQARGEDLDAEQCQLEEERQAVARKRERLEGLKNELDEHEEELEDAESLREMLDVASNRIPTLLTGIQQSIISPEQSRQMALSIAEFYKALIDAEISKGSADIPTLTHMCNLQSTTLRHAQAVRIPDFPKPLEPVRPQPTEPKAPGSEAFDGAAEQEWGAGTS